MRGFLSGMIWGLVLIGGGIVALSLLSPVAPRPDVASDVGGDGLVAPVEGDTSAPANTARDPDLVENKPEAPEPGETEDDTVAVLDTEPGARPSVSETATAPETPTVLSENDPDVETLDEEPKTPEVAPQPNAPEAAMDSPSVSGTATPPVTVSETGTLTEAPEGEDTSPERPELAETPPDVSNPAASVSAPDAEPNPEIATEPSEEPVPAPAPVVAETPETTTPPDKPESADPVVSESAPASVPVPSDDTAPKADVASATPPAPETTPVPPAPVVSEEPEAPRAPPVVRALPGNEATEEESEGSTPRIAALPQNETGEAQELRPTIGQRVVPLTERNAAVQPTGAGGGDSQSPLEAYAADFTNDDGKPMMAIVLIDDDQAVGVEALRDFPYPVSFAVDPAAPDAAQKMQRHRAAGFEVLALVDLPQAGTAQDAEVALTAGFDRLSEALGVLEGTGTGIQGNRPLSDQVIAFVGATGRGLITQGSGLNTVPKLAVREGIPAAPVFRDFDGAGQTPTVMRRFLDQAAFRARQEGAVVMLGRVRPDTISALLIWGLQDRSDELMLAPASAVLKASVSEN